MSALIITIEIIIAISIETNFKYGPNHIRTYIYQGFEL